MDSIIFDENDGLTYLVSGNVIGVIVIIGELVLTGSTIVVHGSSNFIYAVTKIKFYVYFAISMNFLLFVILTIYITIILCLSFYQTYSFRVVYDFAPKIFVGYSLMLIYPLLVQGRRRHRTGNFTITQNFITTLSY